MLFPFVPFSNASLAYSPNPAEQRGKIYIRDKRDRMEKKYEDVFTASTHANYNYRNKG